MIAANENPNDPMNSALKVAQEKTKTVDPELVRCSLMVFISHHPAARSAQFRIPPLSKRAPQNSVPRQPITMAPGPATTTSQQQQQQQQQPLISGSEADLAMSFWRE